MHNRNPHPDDHRRLILFFISAAIIMALSYFFITKPQMDKAREQQGLAASAEAKKAPVAQVVAQEDLQDVATVLADPATTRVAIDAPQLAGSVSTTGLRFDDLQLKSYYTTLENTENVRLLAPSNTKQSFFVEIGLMPQDPAIAVPTKATTWKIVSGDKLTPDTPVAMEWDNGQGLIFRRTVSVDARYLVTVAQGVTNNTKAEVKLFPYASVSQAHHIPAKGDKINFEDQPSSVQHIGPISHLDGKLHEQSYKDLKEKPTQFPHAKGWLGITSKYWLVALLPQKDDAFDGNFTHETGKLKQDIYQTDLREEALVVAPGATAQNDIRFFAGAKKLSILNDYSDKLGVDQLDLAVDFGWLYILTKPLYKLLSMIAQFYAETLHTPVSFGLALLTLTVLLRAATFPLQNKSYRSMNRMKEMGPKTHALKEKYGQDKARFQQEVLLMYKREKINPASGCLPILIQIPIFFSLYKVIYISLDMRHAPFFGWIHDLAAPDPTNVFNLFGMLPFTPPLFLTIGIWPILYGLTMYVQQKLNPKPEDATQQQMFAILPWLFMFIFAKFPAGLVIYYTWSNILGILQQYSLRKIHKVPAVTVIDAPIKTLPQKKKKNNVTIDL